MPDGLVSGLQEMAGRKLSPGLLIHGHRGDTAIGVSVHSNQRDVGRDFGQGLVGRGRGGDHHDPGDPLFAVVLDGLGYRSPVQDPDSAHTDHEPLGRRGQFERRQQRCRPEERRVLRHHPEVLGLSGGKSTSRAVGTVSELFDGCAHTQPRALTNVGMPVEHPGNRLV